MKPTLVQAVAMGVGGSACPMCSSRIGALSDLTAICKKWLRPLFGHPLDEAHLFKARGNVQRGSLHCG